MRAAQRQDDLVLEQPGAVGVLNLLRRPLARIESRLAANRRQVKLGLSPEQQRVTLHNQRARNGTPHWIFADEAHAAFDSRFADLWFADGEKGYCMVTFNPSSVFQQANIEFNFVLLAASGKDTAFTAIEYLSAVTHIPVAGIERFFERATQGHALLVRRDTAVLSHHGRGFDFSRWIEAVMSDAALANVVHGIEQQIAAADNDAALEERRRELLDAIDRRYLS